MCTHIFLGWRMIRVMCTLRLWRAALPKRDSTQNHRESLHTMRLSMHICNAIVLKWLTVLPWILASRHLCSVDMFGLFPHLFMVTPTYTPAAICHAHGEGEGEGPSYHTQCCACPGMFLHVSYMCSWASYPYPHVLQMCPKSKCLNSLHVCPTCTLVSSHMCPRTCSSC